MDDWNNIYYEALDLEKEFIQTFDLSKKESLFSSWITLKIFGCRYTDAEKMEFLERVHTQILKYYVGILYTIDE